MISRREMLVGAAGVVLQGRESYTSEGKAVSVERFEPPGGGKHPAVLLLHGADGMALFPEGYRDACKRLAKAGYVVLIVHYFERTDTKWADMPTMAKHFRTWMQAIGDCIGWVSARPNVDPKQIGLLGISLGASLALSVGATDERVKAVVEYFGALPDELLKLHEADTKRVKMPPTLILHGDKDPIVPVQAAHKLEAHLKAIRAVYEIHIYPGQGHGFAGAAGDDSARRTLDWFNRYLAAAPPAR